MTIERVLVYCMLEKSLPETVFTISIFPVGLANGWDRTKAKTYAIPLCQCVDFAVLCFDGCGNSLFLWFCPTHTHTHTLSLCIFSVLLTFFAFLLPSFWKFDLQSAAVPGNFHSRFGSFSVSFPFFMLSVERLISIVTQSFCKMFRLCFIVVCFFLTKNCQSCRLIVPAELLNGCIFDPMIVSVSHAGFSINRDNCNTAIAKHVFAEQPLVYYGRAKSVIYFYLLSSDRSEYFKKIIFINF